MEPLLGEIRLFPYNYAPTGWMACQGQVLNIAENQALFTLLGVTWGGDGTSTFALPDLRTASPLSGVTGPVGYCIATLGVYPPRS